MNLGIIGEKIRNFDSRLRLCAKRLKRIPTVCFVGSIGS